MRVRLLDMHDVNRRVAEQFRAGGEIPGMHRERLLLLTTTGRRSGEPRMAPMMFVRDGERLFVIASNAGASADPSWYRNLVANPRVSVEVGDEKYDAIAKPLAGAEREAAWQTIVAEAPFFTDHAAKAGRTIPVVELVRTAA